MSKIKPPPSSTTLSVSVSPISSSTSADQDIDGLLSGSAWNLTSLGGVVTYSFPDSAADYSSSISGFQPFNAMQQEAVRTILGTSQTGTHFDSVSQISLIGFTENAGASDASALIRYAERKTTDAYASYPSEKADGGDAWFSGYYDSPAIGSEAYAGILHETGHTLGLKHAFENSGNGPVPSDHNSLEYTVMSYSSYAGAKTWYGADGDYPQTLMMDDIAAIQYMYGADFGTRSGDTTYKWSPTNGALTITDTRTGAESFDAPNIDKIFMTVWDGGGRDTYDFSQFTATGLTIDLRPSHWVETNDYSQTADLGADNDPAHHYAAGIVANAPLYTPYDPKTGAQTGPTNLGSLIENAKGSTNNDVFVANQAVSPFTGDGGNDTFKWASLADVQNAAFRTTTLESTADTITDFNAGDKIDLSAIKAAYPSLTVWATSPSSGEHYVYGDTHGGTHADFAIHVQGSFDPNAPSQWLITT